MQGSKAIERTVRTRTKNPERIEKMLARDKKERAVKARSVQAKISRPLRRALASVGAI